MPPSIPLTGDLPATIELETATPAYKNPFLWVPTSYLAMGLIYVMVGTMATVLFKNMGMSNARASLWSSILGLPYILKFLWAPLLELYKTKKFFVVLMQFAIAAGVVGIALSLKLPGTSWVGPVVGLSAITAVLGATQDIGSDGVYVTTLTPKDQAKYLGFQSMCWNAGSLLAQGLFVIGSGVLHDRTGSWATAWMTILLALAGLMFLAGIYHAKILPPGSTAKDAPKNIGDVTRTFWHALTTFFQKKDVWRMVGFSFFYRFAYGSLDKMGPLFMLDGRENHGLGLTNQQLGQIYGTVATLAFIVGSIVGGWIVARSGLRKTMLFLCLCLNVPCVTFVILSQTMTANIPLIAVLATIEKLGWGIGAVGQMIYMMQQLAPGPYKTAHYTFGTALMGACMSVTGALSGYVQKAVGYQMFFVLVLVATIPSILATLLAPFHHPDVTKKTAEATA
jgi:PAT family beta-lactamase induction signal transducer AmpG